MKEAHNQQQREQRHKRRRENIKEADKCKHESTHMPQPHGKLRTVQTLGAVRITILAGTKHGGCGGGVITNKVVHSRGYNE